MRDVFGSRTSALLKRARRAGCEAFLVTAPADVRYLSGFTGEDSWLLVAPRRRLLITDSRFAEEAGKTCPGWRVHLRKGSISQEAAGIVKSLGLRAGFEARDLTVAAHEALQKHLRGGKGLVPTEGLVAALRIVKDASEVAAIRRAAWVAERAFRRALREVRHDWTENVFAAALEYFMRLEGAEGAAFPTIAACEPASSFPHARPSQARIFNSSTLLVDWGAKVHGYNSDLTRVAAWGKVTPRISRIRKVVRAAQKAAFDVIKPGVAVAGVDAAARKVISDAGYGEFFGHGLGHGVGLEVHEGPALSPYARGRLAAGMVVTVEPGIYIPGVGGVRIEDMVLVAPCGAKLLTHISREPGILGKMAARPGRNANASKIRTMPRRSGLL